jgi:hypothetical protein
MKKRGDTVLTKVRIAGFPLEITVENGKTIRDWPAVRKLLDLMAGELMQLAKDRRTEALERVKRKPKAVGVKEVVVEKSGVDEGKKEEIEDWGGAEQQLGLGDLLSFGDEDGADGSVMQIWNAE